MEPHSLKFFFLGLISLLITHQGMGQEKMNIAAGWGHPEMLNLGLRFQLGQSQIGLSAGFDPNPDDDTAYSAGADYYYHFGGSTDFSKRRPWFGKAGFYYHTSTTEFEKNTYLFLVPRIGRDFNLSRKFGIALELGVSLRLFSEETQLKPSEFQGWFGDDLILFTDVGPSLGFSLFYRL